MEGISEPDIAQLLWGMWGCRWLSFHEVHFRCLRFFPKQELWGSQWAASSISFRKLSDDSKGFNYKLRRRDLHKAESAHTYENNAIHGSNICCPSTEFFRIHACQSQPHHNKTLTACWSVWFLKCHKPHIALYDFHRMPNLRCSLQFKIMNRFKIGSIFLPFGQPFYLYHLKDSALGKIR